MRQRRGVVEKKQEYKKPELEDLSKKKTRGQGNCVDGSSPPTGNCGTGVGATSCKNGTGDVVE
jgi:hypothetical protein